MRLVYIEVQTCADCPYVLHTEDGYWQCAKTGKGLAPETSWSGDGSDVSTGVTGPIPTSCPFKEIKL